MVYYDKNYVLIKYGVTAAKDAVKNLQCLDANNGEILWTQPISGKYDYSSYYAWKTALIDGKFYIKTNSGAFIFTDVKGKDLSYIEIPSEF